MTAKSKRGVSAIDFNVKGQIETEAAMAEWHMEGLFHGMVPYGQVRAVYGWIGMVVIAGS